MRLSQLVLDTLVRFLILTGQAPVGVQGLLTRRDFKRLLCGTERHVRASSGLGARMQSKL